MTPPRIEEVKAKLRDATTIAMDKRELEMHCGNALIAIESLEKKISELQFLINEFGKMMSA